MADNVDITAGSGTTIGADETTISGTAVKVQRVSLGSAPTLTITRSAPTTSAASQLSANVERKGLLIKNNGTVQVFLGPTGVTTATGFPLDAGETIGSNSLAAIFAITASGTGALSFWEES